MRYLSLPAWRDGRPLYLSELILAFGWSVVDLTWSCNALEIGPGPEISSLEAVAGNNKRLTTLELLHLATPYVQVIDGELIGYNEHDGQVQPAVLIRAVDSTSWDLGILDEENSQRITDIFPEAVELDPKLFNF
jgi:hypothetical protein